MPIQEIELVEKGEFGLPGHRKVYVGHARQNVPGAGLGLFSGRPLKSGEIIFIAKGTIVHMETSAIKDPTTYPNALGINSEMWLDPAPTNPLRYMNHSCDPNMGIRGAVTFVALRDIGPDEHLTVDYSITEGDPPWQLDSVCKCGSPLCRGIVRSIQHLPHELYLKYMPCIPRKFQKVYMKYRRERGLPTETGD